MENIYRYRLLHHATPQQIAINAIMAQSINTNSNSELKNSETQSEKFVVGTQTTEPTCIWNKNRMFAGHHNHHAFGRILYRCTKSFQQIH